MPQPKNERDQNPDNRKNTKQPTGARKENERVGGDAARTKANRPQDSAHKPKAGEREDRP